MTAEVKLKPLAPAEESADNPVPLPIVRALAPLHCTALGVACGVVGGAFLALSTLSLVLRPVVHFRLDLLSQFLWGYRVSPFGILIGLLWGFAVGFILGYGFAMIRNIAVSIWLATIKSRAEMEEYSDFLDHL
jgi:hypothetical protein